MRIVVFGTECTGKTTLARALAHRLACPWSVEYVRTFWHQVDGDIRAEHLSRIAAGQLEIMAAARAGVGRASPACVIHDTDLLSHQVWVDLLFAGYGLDWVRETADIQARRTTHYLLCDIDIIWQADAQRGFPEPGPRRQVHERFRDALDQRGLAYTCLAGDLETRVRQAVQVIKSLSDIV